MIQDKQDKILEDLFNEKKNLKKAIKISRRELEDLNDNLEEIEEKIQSAFRMSPPFPGGVMGVGAFGMGHETMPFFRERLEE